MSPRALSHPFVAFVAIAACGGTPKPSGTTAATPSGADVAHEGETCGGATIAPAVPRSCAAGLECRNEANDATSPGTCQQPLAAEGEACGGATTPPAVPRRCAVGLVCRNEAHDVTFPGKCVKQ